MPAAFRPCLALDHDTCSAGLEEANNGAADVHERAVASVAVGHDEDGRLASDLLNSLRHLFECYVALGKVVAAEGQSHDLTEIDCVW